MTHRRKFTSDHAYPRYPNLVQGLTMMRPDHVWVSDSTDIRLHDEFVYLAVLMDVDTRSIRGWHLSRHLDHVLTLTALRRAVEQNRPEIHHAAHQGIDRFLDHVYQHKRIHSALGYLPPAEFETQWRPQTAAASVPLERP